MPFFALALPAFDGAEGFGADTTHARGTGVCVVNNLLEADKSQETKYLPSGSLRYCLAEAQELGGRYVVFHTSGTIKLRRPALVPSNTYIAGQTSAGGIAIEGQAILVKNAQDVVICHIRHRESRRKADAFNIIQSTDSRNKPCFSATASRCPPLTAPVIIDQLIGPALLHAFQSDLYRAPSGRYRWFT